MGNSPATEAASVSFERMQAQASASVRRDAQRVHDLAERFREDYRGRLQEWVQLRARLDRRGSTLHPVGPDALRAQHELLGRELASLQARLKRLEVAARQLDVLATFVAEADAHADEPSLAGDDSPDAIRLRIIDAQEGERLRLAEDVHDGPAQVLTNAIFQVDYVDRMLGKADLPVRDELTFLRDLLREGLEDVRNLITHLRPPMVDVGLAAAIDAQAAELQKRHGIAVRVDVAGLDERLSPADRASVLRIIQEALQNVRKHADATEVVIGLEADRLVIADNGRGFDVVRLATGVSRNFGLQFMRERAELLGGQLQIESRQGEGTRILVRVPEAQR